MHRGPGEKRGEKVGRHQLDLSSPFRALFACAVARHLRALLDKAFDASDYAGIPSSDWSWLARGC